MKKILVLAIVALACFVTAPNAFAATFTVDSVLDTGDSDAGDNLCDIGDGSCTLRAALEQAQATAGTDVVTIDASLIGQTTSPTTAYANQSGQTVSIIGPGMNDFTIDAAAANILSLFSFSDIDNGTFSGFSVINVFQVGFLVTSDSNTNTFTDIGIHGEGTDTGGALIQLNGSSSNIISECELSEGGLGVRIQENSDYNTVENCISTSQQHSGLTIYDSAYNTLSGNTITDSDEAGMFIIFGADHNTIEENTITDSAELGITMGALGADSGTVNNNIFRNNTITGTLDGNAIQSTNDNSIEDATFTGNIIKNNNGTGIVVSGVVITIGGTNPGDGNIIGGNTHGIHIINSDDVTIVGNYIGLDEDGTTSLPNSFPNINIGNNSTNVTIGGATADSRNYIAGNGDISVIFGGASSNILVQNNYMGLDINGDLVGPEGGFHLFIDEGSNDIMVGGTSDVGNIIS